MGKIIKHEIRIPIKQSDEFMKLKGLSGFYSTNRKIINSGVSTFTKPTQQGHNFRIVIPLIDYLLYICIYIVRCQGLGL